MNLEKLKQIGSQLLHLPQALQEAKDLGLTTRTRKHAPLTHEQQGEGVKPRRQLPRYIVAMRLAAEEKHPKPQVTKVEGAGNPPFMARRARVLYKGEDHTRRTVARAKREIEETVQLDFMFRHPNHNETLEDVRKKLDEGGEPKTGSSNWK